MTNPQRPESRNLPCRFRSELALTADGFGADGATVVVIDLDADRGEEMQALERLMNQPRGAPPDAATRAIDRAFGWLFGPFHRFFERSAERYGGGVTRGLVKSLGYDVEKQMSYFVADTDIDHEAGAIMHNKSNTGLVHMLQTSHNDNQTYDVKVIRNQYAHGDTYIYYCDFNYMSNIHSAAGDENGNCYAAFIRSKEDNFKGTVESVDWENAKLVFGNSAQNVQTLGDSRPLINRNPKKHITAGKVLIVTGRGDFDLPDPKMSLFEGTDYSTGLVKSPISNSLGMGPSSN